jgi:peptide/nickel transport system permease protein
MAVYIIRRLIWLPVVLFIVSVITLALGLYGPGGPIQALLGLKARPETVERFKREYGLDQPFPVIYFNYVTHALQGDFGTGLSRYADQPVARIIGERLPVTAQLNLISLVFGSVIGIIVGVYAGLHRNSRFDYIARFLSLAAISVPLLFLLPFLTFIFSRRHEFPIGVSTFSIGPILPLVSGKWEGVFSLQAVLPILIESMGFIAIFIWQMRAGIIDTLGQDYVRTARAKGLKEQAVIFRHAMRNALIPIATILTLSLGDLVVGSFLIEPWFGIPGIGQLGLVAFIGKEYYIMLALTLLIAISFVVAGVLLDLLYPILDPRIRKT